MRFNARGFDGRHVRQQVLGFPRQALHHQVNAVRFREHGVLHARRHRAVPQPHGQAVGWQPLVHYALKVAQEPDGGVAAVRSHDTVHDAAGTRTNRGLAQRPVQQLAIFNEHVPFRGVFWADGSRGAADPFFQKNP